VAKIVYLRQHSHFGPLKISMYFKRYHDIETSNSGVWRVLDRLGMGWLLANQRYKRHKQRWKCYEKPQPGHQVQIDVKFIALIAGVTAKKHYQFTVIDDTKLFNDKLKQWEDYHNYDRSYDSFGGQTSYERLKQKITRPQ